MSIPTLGNPHLERVYAAKTPAESRTAYDIWAKTFDADMIEQDYVAPQLCAEAIVTQTKTTKPASQLSVLDAGCGTGACGIELSKLDVSTIDGLDYSPGMLDVARKLGLYRKLETVDLFQPIESVQDAAYDAVICVGTLTEGHVGPDPALGEFVRVVRKGGVVVATVLESIWEKGRFGQVVDGLRDTGKVEIVSRKTEHYRRRAGAKGIILVLRKL